MDSNGCPGQQEPSAGTAVTPHDVLAHFLERCASDVMDKEAAFGSVRTTCAGCGGSRSLYCFECCQLMLQPHGIPQDVCDLDLPFAVDLILDDRRASSTGVALKTLMDQSSSVSNCRLIDREGNADQIPEYSDNDGTYLLFPGEDAFPLSAVASNVFRIVVLDCKWAKSSIRLDNAISKLPRVQLDNNCPRKSYYWRWHNAGDGMLSTIEAVYYSAWEVASARGWSSNEKEKLVYMLWLFGIQRATISQRYKHGLVRCDNQEPTEPFMEDYKDHHRTIRQKQKLKHLAEKQSREND